MDDGFAQAFAALIDLQLEHGADVFFDIELPKDGRLLRQVAQAQARALVDGQVLDTLAIDADFAGIGGHEAHDHVKTGGFASAVVAQQADDLAGRHRHMHVVHHGAGAVALLEAFGAQFAARGRGRRRDRRCAHQRVLSALAGSVGARGVITPRTRPVAPPLAPLPTTWKTEVLLS